MSPEVLIYIQTVKNFFTINEEAKNYFIGKSDENLFYKHLAEISQKNYEKAGEVTLTKEQFELLRKTIKVISIVKNDVEVDSRTLFFEVPGYGNFSLN